MGCDQTEDLDGAFVPPLSDHPCLQCPAPSMVCFAMVCFHTETHHTGRGTIPNQTLYHHNTDHTYLQCPARSTKNTVPNHISPYPAYKCTNTTIIYRTLYHNTDHPCLRVFLYKKIAKHRYLTIVDGPDLDLELLGTASHQAK